jgi:voltage-gated potassium channel
LSETNIRSELDIVIVSIRRSHGEIVFNPSGEAKIETGDMLIAIGKGEALAKLNELARGHAIKQERVKA